MRALGPEPECRVSGEPPEAADMSRCLANSMMANPMPQRLGCRAILVMFDEAFDHGRCVLISFDI